MNKKGIIAAAIVLVLQLALLPVYADDYLRQTIHYNEAGGTEPFTITVDVIAKNMSEGYFDGAIDAIKDESEMIYEFNKGPLSTVTGGESDGSITLTKIAENYIIIYLEEK